MRENKSKIKIILFVLCGACLCFGFILPACAEKEFVYDSQGKRNPFIPLVTADGRLLKLEDEGGSSVGLSLEGIVYDKYGQSFALVNGEPVKVGDTIGEYQVLKIEARKAIFIKEGQTYEMELKKEGEE